MNTNESKKSRSHGNSHNQTVFSNDNNLAEQLVHAPAAAAVAVADDNSNRSMMNPSDGQEMVRSHNNEPSSYSRGSSRPHDNQQQHQQQQQQQRHTNQSVKEIKLAAANSNSNNGRDSSVKFAMPAEFVAYEPRTSPFGGKMISSSTTTSTSTTFHSLGMSNNGSTTAAPINQPVSGSGGSTNTSNNHNNNSNNNNFTTNNSGAYSSGSLSSMGNYHASGPSSSAMTTVVNLKNNTSSNIVFSNSQNNSGVSSGSGSDNNGGATSSSGNAAVVTTSTSVTCNNNSNTTSSGSGSGDDDRSSSGSGRGSGSGSGSGNRRSAGEASGEFYYAGYSSNQATSSVGDHHHRHHHPQGLAAAALAAPNQANGTMGNMNGTNNTMNMPSFASFRGASLAASNAATAVGRPTSQPSNIIHVGTNNNNMGTTTRHVGVAATDDGPPTPTLRVTRHHNHHHSSHGRYHHNHRRSNVQGQGGGLPVDNTVTGNTHQGTRDGALPNQDRQPQAGAANAASASRPTAIAAPQPPAVLNGGIPSAIDRPSAAMPRPQSSEQVHSQQVQLQQYRGTSSSHAHHHADRHHRHHHLHHHHQQQQQQSQSQLHHELRLPPPPIDDQAILQRVPRTHATVVARDLPPPPTSFDAWSLGSSSSRSRALAAVGRCEDHANNNNSNSHNASSSHHAHPMVASVRLAYGGAVDSVNMSDGSSPPPSLDQKSAKKPTAMAMHVTTDDPILRKKIVLKHQHQVPQQPMAEAKKPSPDAVMSPAMGNASSSKAIDDGMKGANNKNNAALKRKISAMQQQQQSSMRGESNSDDSFDSAKSRSGSDEGYAASLEHQSGSSGSGSDSISSDDANKKDNVASSSGRVRNGGNGGATGLSKGKAGGAFSSVMNEEGTISLSRSESPRSSCTSLSSNGDNHMNDGTTNNKGTTKSENGAKSNQAAKAAKSSSKRDSTCLLHASSANNARKRFKQSMAAVLSSDHAKKPSSADVANGFGPTNNAMMSGLSIMEKSLQQKARSSNHHNQHHHYHSRSTGRKMLEKSFLSAKHDLSTADAASALASLASSVPSSAAASVEHRGRAKRMGGYKSTGCDYAPSFMKQDATSFREASIYSLGQDVMAQVVQFLEPPEIHSFLTTPLSKTWLVTYTAPQELWKILCTAKPFYAKLDEGSLCGSNGSSDGSTCSFPMCSDLEMRHLFGRYRLLYTSFVRCMKYLNRLQDDALNGRTPTGYNSNETQNDIYPYHKNVSLKAYFAKARRLVRSSNPRRNGGGSRSSSDAALSITSESGSYGSDGHDKRSQSKRLAAANAASVSGKTNGSGSRQQRNGSEQRFGRSMLTNRLLRANVNLPWSCAIYSVVNWMVAFTDVEGIQIMCLKCLPYLLEDESQRTTAQLAGLTDSVLRAMVLFPDSIELHTVAFHTLVLLARPLGGNEGMLFHTAMVNTRGIFNNGSNNSKNGIVIMLDSMRRFAQDEILQAMSCWSLVNVALTPLQKSMLVKLGGLTVTSNAMLQHPYNAEVQFRALFALINLVIPTETRPDETEEMREFEREIFQQLGEVGETSEKEMLDASVGQISNLVVVSMKNFCSSEAILNRACLVLHNLSLKEEYHSILLWTPNCYQMLEWCLGNYPHDHVLQQSAGGTIQRLNATLSADEELRARFTQSIRAQQQHSLELARQEAVMLQEQQREQAQMDVS